MSSDLSHFRFSLGFALLCALAGCGSIDIPTSSAGCQTDDDCLAESLCVDQVCTSLAEDTDLDGLTNGVEKELGTDPSRSDSDGDGINDDVEVGEISAPTDSDGDGVIDALESASADADLDCINDQLDANDASDTAVVKKLELCQLEGVCGGDVQPKAECAPASNPGDEPTWFCSYGGVVGYNPGEDALCDGLDNDCDGLADEDFEGVETTCGLGACATIGTTSCVEGVEVDGCEPLAASVLNDTMCDGIDNDCDGETDEEYVGPDGFCGQGACKRSGSTVCFNGVPTLDCIEGAPAANDETCDGIDDDCDAKIDEDFDGATTTCGSGGCATEGQYQCLEGVEVDDCVAGSGAPTDGTCDGVDDDCDGETDEDYLSTNLSTTCGIGACAASGAELCINGQVLDTCVEGSPAESDASCNGLDDDCNGEIDEDFVSESTLCGTGACQSTGTTSCVLGDILDSCSAVEVQQASDLTCDGIDDNCNGETDEGFESGTTQCGKGVCASEGYQTCEGGEIVNTCVAGEAPDDELDASCDGLDQDCDGALDEGFTAESYSCGQGECLVLGETTCIEGLLGGTCAALSPLTESDAGCDDLDQDCDGEVDEDFVSEVVACGVESCSGSAVTSCEAGLIKDGCDAGDGGGVDASCDGVDDDCDDAFDEDYQPIEISCGLGVCTKSLLTSCVEGSAATACIPNEPIDELDVSCNGLDDDCDGETDEGFQAQSVECGTGACLGIGNLACVDGAEVNTCTPGPPGPNDASCNGVDNDCDGETDEDFVESATSCGVGVCAQSGSIACLAGQVVDTCSPLESLGPDITCDGLDDDCDGITDEDYVASASECGVGACASSGQKSCINGTETNTCSPGVPALDDLSCDGIDDNCDGFVDEGYVASNTTCGVGKCQSTGSIACIGGTPTNTCTPGVPEPSDVTCDGVDDNCNGVTDEDFATEAITCGVGACLANGTRTCSNGAPNDNCVAGTPAASDATCDGLDDDCNGQADDGYVVTITSCGDGACASNGELICVSGQETSTCVEVAPGATDDNCDGVDDDCNGVADDAYVSVDFECGVGECASVGQTFCMGGNILNDCQPSAPEADDTTCDGKDNDCNGDTDEDFVSQTTGCGQGACQSSGVTSCVAGQIEDSCEASSAPTGDTDSACDGLDSDCDGELDEGYIEMEVTCGSGVCANTGQLVCQGAPDYEVNTCEVLSTTATADYACNGLDDDCDGETDEDYVSVQTECGQGVCATTSMSICAPTIGGPGAGPSDNCFPVQPSPTEQDTYCNGQDDDCDGEIDEGYIATSTTCGSGNCQSEGVSSCTSSGVELDSCLPGSPALASNGSIAPDDCGGGDSDCDGELDEDFEQVEITCGVGTCASSVTTFCSLLGNVVGTCVPTGEPSCENKACGDDGCGGSCGECESNEACAANFQCICQPDCLNKACGGDGCGGSCGVCPSPDPCQVAQCNTGGTCAFYNLEDWTSCDDGSDDTVGDFCASGRCIGFDYRLTPPESEVGEVYVSASRRTGGGVHALYTRAGEGKFLAGVESCLDGGGCQTELLGPSGSHQAISPSYLHISAGLSLSEDPLWRTTSEGYAKSGTNVQTHWNAAMSYFNLPYIPSVTLINNSPQWLVGVHLYGDDYFGFYHCGLNTSYCEFSNPPEEYKDTQPVKLRMWQDRAFLALNDPDTEKGVYLTSSNGLYWEATGTINSPRRIKDFVTVTDDDGVLIRVAVGESGLIHWSRKEEDGFISLPGFINMPGSSTNQDKLQFKSVSRLGNWLVAFAYDAGSEEYVLAYVRWNQNVMDSSLWGVMPTTIYKGDNESLSFHQSDNENLYLYGGFQWPEGHSRMSFHAGIPADTLLLDEDFGDDFNPSLWEEALSCTSSGWSVSQGELLFSEGCADPEVPEAALELGGALFYRSLPSTLGERFTLRVQARPGDDDGYGVVYSLEDKENYYRVHLNKERGFVRLERIENGSVSVLGERTDISLSSNEPVEIMVERIGPLHRVSLDGDVSFQANDSLFAGKGVGVFTWAMESALFYHIKLTRPSVP